MKGDDVVVHDNRIQNWENSTMVSGNIIKIDHNDYGMLYLYLDSGHTIRLTYKEIVKYLIMKKLKDG